MSSSRKKAMNLLFEEIEQDVLEKERFIVSQIEQMKVIYQNYQNLLDQQKILESVQVIIPMLEMGGANVNASVHGGINFKGSLNYDDEQANVPLVNNAMQMPSEAMGGISITHVAGTIDADEKDRMKRLLFRITRGKALTYFNDFEQQNAEGQDVKKSVYIIVFQEGRMIRDRI